MNTDLLILQKSRQLRRDVLDIVYAAGRGHLGGIFSVVEILTTLVYSGHLHLADPGVELSDKIDEDILLMGKGHAGLAWYWILADLGYITFDQLRIYGQNGSLYNVQMDTRIPKVWYNTGSLGHVIGIGAGLALAQNWKGNGQRVFAIVGDGECEEGSVWESIDFAVKHKLSNLIVIVDCNQLSVTGRVSAEQWRKKFAGFGCSVYDVHGHDPVELREALRSTDNEEKVSVLLASTVKGKGVSFLENDVHWHHGTLTDELYIKAKKELR